MINKYREVPYIKGGRDLDGLDCWGLVRLLRIDLGYPELPLFSSVDPLDKRGLTRSTVSCIADCELKKVNIRHGAIASAYRGKLCYHVGIVLQVNNKLMIAETDEPHGFTMSPINIFEARYTKVEYYD